MYSIKDRLTTLLIGALAVSVVIGLMIYVENQAQKKKDAAIIKSQYPDYDTIKGTNPDPNIKVLKITESCPNNCVNDKPATDEFDGIEKKIFVKGKFSRAYLYFEGAVDYGRPLTVWDDFYFKVNDLVGGHLITDENNLPVPPSEFSVYLYDLRSISYFPTIGDKEKKISRRNHVNLFSLLQNNYTLSIHTSISSDRSGRIMKEVSIYYECFSGSECSIEEQK